MARRPPNSILGLESHTQKQMPPDTKTSKFLSLVLRHKPDAIGLKLDASGWADIADLIAKARLVGVILTSGKIARIVATSDKRRFAISDDGNRIRANQGHSVPVTPQTRRWTRRAKKKSRRR